mmetsp:Transcript_19545/g.50057  ORF Transcript_19545/g.50057 Transcript_19545/m.50057 type:complete len:232 (-) Transcript_19545:224-919(-)
MGVGELKLDSAALQLGRQDEATTEAGYTRDGEGEMGVEDLDEHGLTPNPLFLRRAASLAVGEVGSEVGQEHGSSRDEASQSRESCQSAKEGEGGGEAGLSRSPSISLVAMSPVRGPRSMIGGSPSSSEKVTPAKRGRGRTPLFRKSSSSSSSPSPFPPPHPPSSSNRSSVEEKDVSSPASTTPADRAVKSRKRKELLMRIASGQSVSAISSAALGVVGAETDGEKGGEGNS